MSADRPARGAGEAAVIEGSVFLLDGACYKVFLRSRLVGEESVRVAPGPEGGVVLESRTRFGIGPLRLEQTTIAGLGPDREPRWCRMSVASPTLTVGLEIAVEPRLARVRHSAEGRVEEQEVPLGAGALLLVDNCFALHALAALAALRGAPAPGPWIALPLGREVTASVPGAGEVPSAGTRLPRPDVTLCLGEGLEEHAWVAEGRVDRLMIPALQARAERVAAPSGRQGGSA